MAGKKTQALSLLEGILDETQAEAEAAQQALDEELKRKEAEAKRVAEEAETAKRAELERRMAEEADRQRTAAERREAAAEAMRIEELKAQGLWVEPEPEPAPPVEAPVADVGTTREVVAAQEKSKRGTFFAAAAALLILGGGAAGAWVYLNQEFVDASTPFTASAPDTVLYADASAVVAFRAIPDPIVQEAAAPEPEPERRSSSRSSTRRESESSRSSDSGSSSGSTPPRRFNLGENLRRD